MIPILHKNPCNKILEKIQTFFQGRKNALSCIIQSAKIQKIKKYCLFDIRKEFLKYLILIKNYSTKEQLLLTPSKTSQLRGYLNQSDVSIVG